MLSGAIGGVLAVLLVAASLLLLGYLCTLLFRAVSGPLGPLLERGRLKHYAGHAERGDALVRDGQLDRALDEYLKAFCPLVPDSRQTADAVVNHHTGLLSRLIAAADQAQGGTVRLLSLAGVDRLLHQRAALLRQIVAVRQGGRPERRRQVEQELSNNAAELESALGSLVAEIRACRQRQQARYH